MLSNSPGASPPPFETATTEIELTLLDKWREPFTKTIDFVNDELVYTGGSSGMRSGHAYKMRFIGLTGHKNLICRIAGNQALTLGVFEGGTDLIERAKQTWLPPVHAPYGAVTSVGVATQWKLQHWRDEGYDVSQVIARSAECLQYAIGRPVLVLLDCDLKGSSPHWSSHFSEHPEAVWECYCEACPGLIGAGHVYRRSTSAALSHPPTGKVFPGSGGTHTYVIVRDSTDIPRALNALHERLWLVGYGWGYIADHGGLLPRSLADTTVGKGERACFEANPVLLGGLVQDAAARIPVAVEGSIVDTKVAIPDLTGEERARFDKLWAAEQERLADKAAAVREVWIRAKAEKMADEQGRDLADCLAAVERSSHTKMNRPTANDPYAWTAELLPPFELLFRNPELEGATVADVLSDLFRFKGEDLADPHGGLDYDPRRDKAIIVWPRNGKPYIDSRAHGGGRYALVDDDPDWTVAGVRGRQSRKLFAAAGVIEEDPSAPPAPQQGSASLPRQRYDARHSIIARLATQMLANGTPADTIRSLLHAHNKTLPPPLLAARVDELIENARAFLKEPSNVG